jgi:hypothetical protein
VKQERRRLGAEEQAKRVDEQTEQNTSIENFQELGYLHTSKEGCT